ncbi:MAG TPA: universal stress protein [Bacteroidia bacterium]|nr:universal stress protein [Bacteroidia bacterium]
MAYSTILIAVDGSECSTNAVKKGIELAKDLSAKVILLSVVDMTSMVDNAAVGAIIDKDVEGAFEEEADKLLDKLMKKYPYDKITKISEEGIAKEAINTIAEHHKVDLIVMGTHGRTGLSHLFMGSVAEHVVRHSKIPVMVIATPEA